MAAKSLSIFPGDPPGYRTKQNIVSWKQLNKIVHPLAEFALFTQNCELKLKLEAEVVLLELK